MNTLNLQNRAATSISLVALAMTIALTMVGCNHAAPAPTNVTPAPVQPARQPTELDRVAEMNRLESLARQAVTDMDHARVRQAAEAIERLPFALPENADRRQGLVRDFTAEAARLRDALHRFLFVELAPLSPERRKPLLDAAEEGQPDAVPQAGAALAAQEFQANRKYLRATPALKVGTQPTGDLPVRPSPSTGPWQRQFNDGFNRQMLRLARP